VPSDALLPVSGDPYAVASAARTLESVAAEVAATSAKLRAVSVGSWTGAAASRAHQRTVSLPPKLEKVRVSYATAATALGGYASALAQSQNESAAAVRAAEAAAADLAAARALAAAAAGSASPSGSAIASPSAPRYDGEIADAESRLARATAANAAAHDAQRSAARVAAAGLRQASHQGIRNQPWWRHAAGAVAHWASSTWATSLRLVSKVATTVSALAGLAALVVSVAGIFFPPLEAAAAVLETISLVSGIAGTIADTALAATGRASWTAVGFDALGLAPWAGSKLVRKAGRLIRNPRTVVFASTGRSEPRGFTGSRLTGGPTQGSRTDPVIVGSARNTRLINYRPRAADPKWGLRGDHLRKHIFGPEPSALAEIDPVGTPDRWLAYMQDLASRPATVRRLDGVEDIIGTFAKADGSGTFKFGIRVMPTADGSFDLVTLLTRQ